MEEKRVAITTIDNPYDPFDQYTQWFLFDVEKGYNTASKIGRLFRWFEGMTQKEEDQETERVIDRLIEIDPLNIYIKVTKQVNV